MCVCVCVRACARAIVGGDCKVAPHQRPFKLPPRHAADSTAKTLVARLTRETDKTTVRHTSEVNREASRITHSAEAFD